MPLPMMAFIRLKTEEVKEAPLALGSSALWRGSGRARGGHKESSVNHKSIYNSLHNSLLLLESTISDTKHNQERDTRTDYYLGETLLRYTGVMVMRITAL